MSTHQKILEEEYARASYVVDVLTRCRCIMDMEQASIDRRVFSEDFEARDILYAIMRRHGRHFSTRGIVGTGG